MAKETKKSFVLYYDYREHLALLSDEERGRLLMALFDFIDGKEPELTGAALMAFSFIRTQLMRDAEKYAAICRKRSEAGKRGGRQKGTNDSPEKQTEANKAIASFDKQTETKKADNDNDNVTDNDNDNENVNENENDIQPNGCIIPPDGGRQLPPADPTPYKAIVSLYHGICVSYPKLRNVSDARKRAIAARWKEYGHDMDTFRELFEMAEASAFLKGRNPKNWTADFNWLMNSENMAKVLEGKYSNATPKGGVPNGANSGHPHRPEQQDDSAASLSGFRMADA